MKTDERHLKFRSSAIRRAPQVEVIKTVSQTVPEQAMSVRTILKRYVQGMLPDVYDENYYNDINGMDGEDIRGLDLVEIRDRRIRLEEQAEALREEELNRQRTEREEYQKYLRDKEIAKRDEMIRKVAGRVEPNTPSPEDYQND